MSSCASTLRRPSAGARSCSARGFPGSKNNFVLSTKLFELLREEVHRALPCLLRRLRVVLQHVELLLVGAFVRERVLAVVAMELELHVRLAQLLLERIDA